MRFGSSLRPAALAVAFLASLNVASLTSPAAAQSGGRRPVDGVVGVIGDRVILASTIEKELRSDPGFQTATPADRKRAEQEIVKRIAKEEIWIQIGKVIGREDPELFEQQIQSMVDDYMSEQVDKFGSFTRMNAELDALGTSWNALAEEQRNKILRDSARQHAFSQRFHDGFQLLVTPAEMLAFYREHAAEFAARDSADLAWVSIPKSRADAAGKAAAAAEAWRQEAADARDIASRFDGVALPPQFDVRQSADDSRAAFLKELARDGADGAVLGPLDRGDAWFLVKVVRKVTEPEQPFDNPVVQGRIRQFLVNRKLTELEVDVLNWKAQQILRWPAWILATR